MTVRLGGNRKTGAIIFMCSHKCVFDDATSTATPIDGDGDEIICNHCMSTIQSLMSSMILDKLNNRSVRKKKLKTTNRFDLIDLKGD
jgi:hypothetical protein